MLSYIVKFQDKVAAMRSDRGATAVEYGLMVALIAMAIVITVGLLGDQLDALFTSVTGTLGGV